MMSFEYSQYYDTLFLWPLVSMLSVVVVTIINVIKIVKEKKAPKQEKSQWKWFVPLSVAVILFVTEFFTFAHGVHLAFEKEDAQVSSSGEITEFRKSYDSNKFYYEDKVCFGCYVFINGQKYFIMTVGDLEIGYAVTFNYLPKSKIILSIEKAEQPKQNSTGNEHELRHSARFRLERGLLARF